jgi:hypothetical protein
LIDTHHLLLGLLREDRVLIERLDLAGARERIRTEIEKQWPPARQRITTSVDLPLSQTSMRILAEAAHQADELNQNFIDCGHIVLAMLVDDASTEALLLRRHGVTIDSHRELVASLRQPVGLPEPRPSDRMRDEDEEELTQADDIRTPEPLRAAVSKLRHLLVITARHLNSWSEAYAFQRLHRKPWTRKDALGVNRLLLHVITTIPENKITTPCQIGLDEAIPLSALIERYVDTVDDMVGQILSRRR